MDDEQERPEDEPVAAEKSAAGEIDDATAEGEGDFFLCGNANSRGQRCRLGRNHSGGHQYV